MRSLLVQVCFFSIVFIVATQSSHVFGAQPVYPVFLAPKDGSKHSDTVHFSIAAKSSPKKDVKTFVPSSGYIVLSVHTRPPSNTVFSQHLALPSETEIDVDLKPGQYKATALYLSTDSPQGLERPPIAVVNFSIDEKFDKSRGVASVESAAKLSERLKVAKYEPEIASGTNVSGFRVLRMQESPAGDLSVRKGDVITKINGQEVRNLSQIRKMRPQGKRQKIEIDFIRDGVLHNLKID